MGTSQRYADKLIKENLQILNILVVMLMLILGLPFELFHPFYDFLFSPDYPRSRMKGILCTLQKIDLSTRESEADVSIQPKFLIVSVGK